MYYIVVSTNKNVDIITSQNSAITPSNISSIVLPKHNVILHCEAQIERKRGTPYLNYRQTPQMTLSCHSLLYHHGRQSIVL